MYSPALSGCYVPTQGNESTYVSSDEPIEAQALSITTASESAIGSIIMGSADSTTIHSALESPMACSSFFLQSSISVSKPSYAAPSAFEVGICTFDENKERLCDSMSWTQASDYNRTSPGPK
jgi:hypothetical protein